MATKLTGGCQCGNIRYEVIGEPQQLVVCHCTDCQKQSSSAFGMTLVVNEEEFSITQGEPKIYASKSEAGRAKTGGFCSECGNRIFHKNKVRKGKVSVKAGTLDDTSTLKPDKHIWTKSKQPWITIPEDMETHEKNPS